MKKITLKIVLALSTILMLFSASSFAQSASVLEVYALDTIAGYGTSIRTSQTNSSAEMVFEVLKPNGELIELPAYTNSVGVAKVDLSDYYIKEAGVYKIAAHFKDKSLYSRANTFEVYPSNVSLSKSKVSPEDQVVRGGQESAFISVELMDEYGNAIKGHQVKLVSSSSNDEISVYSDSDISDVSGEVSFEVSSSELGAVTYSAYDVNADIVLDTKAKVVYFDSNVDLFSSNVDSYDYEYAATGNSSGAIDHFEFEDVSLSISPGDSLSFAIAAYDSLDQKVVDYDGSVRFSVVGDNGIYVNLPDDYTFTIDDLGAHTFSLALSFQQAGSYEVEVRAVDDVEVIGTYTFDVMDTTSITSNSSISITNPVAGTYSNSILVISGVAEAGSQLKIFDNDIELSSVVAGVSGEFSYTTSALVDGTHLIYIARVNEVGTIVDTSDVVDVNIDTNAPEISQVIFEPDDIVSPGSDVTLSLQVTDSLSQAALVFVDNIYELEKQPDGSYMVSIVAPLEIGDYDLSFVLVDELGNESRFDNHSVLKVGSNISDVGDVSNLNAVSSDTRVTLTWTAPATGADVDHYRVYYGLSPNQLTEAVDTFTNSPTWYLPNLRNGVEYYFAVIAIDDKGNMSEHFSNIVASTPNPDVVDTIAPDVAVGSAGEEALEDLESDVSDAGPDLYWLIILSAIGGIFYSQAAKRRILAKEKR